MIKGVGWVICEAGVDGAGLDDGAGGGDEPVPALRDWQAGDGSGGGIAGRDPGNERELLLDGGQFGLVKTGDKRLQTRLVEGSSGFEKTARAAKEDDAG